MGNSKISEKEHLNNEEKNTQLRLISEKEHLNNEEKNTQLRLQKFVKFLSKEPDPSYIKTNKYANNSQYLPVSFIEMNLDEAFFGLWQIDNFSYTVIVNEIVGSVDLKIFHPISKMWLTRTGCASVQIQLEKGAGVTNIEKKGKNTLVKDFPHLKTECIKNAAKSIGKLFGRDLNRQEKAVYMPVIPMKPRSSLDKE